MIGRMNTVAGDLDRGRFRPRLGGGKRGVRMRVLVWVANRGVCREGVDRRVVLPVT